MGCRSSTPLDVIEADAHRVHSLEALTLAELAGWERRAQLHRSRGRRFLTQDERLADIAALQQSLSVMEDFFQSLVGQAQSYMEAMDPNNVTGGGPPPASSATMLSLLQTPFTPQEVCVSPCNKGCSICCEEYFHREMVTRLPCGHFYHFNCVETWLQKHCTCPTCRYELPTDDPDFEEGRMERMGERNLPPSSTQEDDSSSQDSAAHHDSSAWDDERSWGEEGVHLMQDFHAFIEDDQYREQVEGSSMFDTGARESWVLRRAFRTVNEDDEERNICAIPTVVERSRVQSGFDISPFESFTVVGQMPDEDDARSVNTSDLEVVHVSTAH